MDKIVNDLRYTFCKPRTSARLTLRRECAGYAVLRACGHYACRVHVRPRSPIMCLVCIADGAAGFVCTESRSVHEAVSTTDVGNAGERGPKRARVEQ